VSVLDVTKNLNQHKVIPIILGIIIGLLLSIVSDLTYVYVFHESSSTFYLFAGLALLGGPLIGGLIAALIIKEHKFTALLISGFAIFVILLILSILSYLVFPLFSYESVQLPASCINNASSSSSHMPYSLNYSIPGVGIGKLLTSDNNSAVVVMSDYDHLPYPSTVYLINRSGNKVLRSLNFDNDIIAAAIDQGTLNLFNDKIGYYINTENGEFVNTIVRLDNYRGLFASDDHTYVQTTFETSVLNADGSVGSHRRMYMNCTAFGCFISGSTGQIIL
jgi:hypothetical protein